MLLPMHVRVSYSIWILFGILIFIWIWSVRIRIPLHFQFEFPYILISILYFQFNIAKFWKRPYKSHKWVSIHVKLTDHVYVFGYFHISVTYTLFSVRITAQVLVLGLFKFEKLSNSVFFFRHVWHTWLRNTVGNAMITKSLAKACLSHFSSVSPGVRHKSQKDRNRLRVQIWPKGKRGL